MNQKAQQLKFREISGKQVNFQKHAEKTDDSLYLYTLNLYLFRDYQPYAETDDNKNTVHPQPDHCSVHPGFYPGLC